jgi:hypothetical protein
MKDEITGRNIKVRISEVGYKIKIGISHIIAVIFACFVSVVIYIEF